MRTTKQAAILCLGAAFAAVPAAADDHAPGSLRMREPRSVRPRWNALPLGRRVAQVPPDGQPGDAPGDPPPAPPADPRPTPPDSSTPAPPADPRSTPPDSSPPTPPADPTPSPSPPSSPPEPTDGAARVDGKTEV